MVKKENAVGSVKAGEEGMPETESKGLRNFDRRRGFGQRGSHLSALSAFSNLLFLFLSSRFTLFPVSSFHGHEIDWPGRKLQVETP